MPEKKLETWVYEARSLTLSYLREHGACSQRELEGYVASILNIVETKKEGIRHRTKPIHGLAFIIAYKELESERQIKIRRPLGVPFPMTDFETSFALRE